MSEGNKPRVLIADDEAHIRMMMKAVIKRMDYDLVGEAKDGLEAVELYKKLTPDLLLMDINMPNKTGDEALKDIIEHDPDAFVIMLTSVADKETIDKCLSIGAANYLLKNTPINDIKTMITEAWNDFYEEEA